MNCYRFWAFWKSFDEILKLATGTKGRKIYFYISKAFLFKCCLSFFVCCVSFGEQFQWKMVRQMAQGTKKAPKKRIDFFAESETMTNFLSSCFFAGPMEVFEHA